MKPGLFTFFIVLLFISCENKKQEALKNEVITRLPAEPDRLNPILSTSGYASQVESHLFLTLLKFDPQSLELTPCLAISRPEISEITDVENKKKFSYTFEIHEPAIWDDGKPVTGHDFVFTMKAILHPKVEAPAYRAYFNFVENIQIDKNNPKKFTIFIDRPYILAEAALGDIPLYPEHVYDPDGVTKNYSFKTFSNQDSVKILIEQDSLFNHFAESFNSPKYSREKGFVTGCGAYRLDEWVAGERIVLNKKEAWWGDQISADYPMLKALPEKIIFRPIPDGATAVSLLKSQELGAMGSIQAENFVELSENELITQLYHLHTPPYMAYYYISFNSNNPKLESKNVRRAIAHLFDIEAVIQSVMFGYAQRIVGPIHPTKPYYHKSLQPISFDIELAKKLLSEAGWTDADNDGWLDKIIDGEQVKFDLSYKYTNGNDVAQSIGLLLKYNAKKVGIDLDLRAKEFSELVNDARKRDFELYYLAWSNPPTLDDLRQIWHTSSDTPKGSNRVGFGNAETDGIIDSIRIEMDEEKRNELYLQIQELIYEDQPYIFLFAPKERIAIHKRFEAETSALRPGFFENQFKLVKSESAGY